MLRVAVYGNGEIGNGEIGKSTFSSNLATASDAWEQNDSGRLRPEPSGAHRIDGADVYPRKRRLRKIRLIAQTDVDQDRRRFRIANCSRNSAPTTCHGRHPRSRP